MRGSPKQHCWLSGPGKKLCSFSRRQTRSTAPAQQGGTTGELCREEQPGNDQEMTGERPGSLALQLSQSVTGGHLNDMFIVRVRKKP